jgi:hypothetical protein
MTMAATERPGVEDHETLDALGAAIRAALYAHNQRLADRIFERIEKRVVPKNIRGMVEVVVNLRTASIDGEISNLRTQVAACDQRLMREITRVIETPFPDPAAEPKKRRTRTAKSKHPAKRKSLKS